MQSGLVLMIPLVVDEDSSDGNNDVVLNPLSGPMMAYITAHTSKTNQFDVPSQWWGQIPAPDLMMSLLATSTKGAISILPDYMGYGWNEKLFRGFLLRKTYLTSFIPLWMKIRSSLQVDTDCESRLADTAFVQGYSEGGYASIAIGDGLKSALEVDIKMVYSGGGPSNATASLKHLFQSFKAGSIDGYLYVALMMGSSYSSTIPDVSNYGSRQDLLSTKYNSPDGNNAIDWLDEFNITADVPVVAESLYDLAFEANISTNDIITDVWNPIITSYIEHSIENDLDPCSTSSEMSQELGHFCNAVQENDIMEVLYDATYQIHICHGLHDDLVPFEESAPVDLQSLSHISVSQKNETHDDAENGACIPNTTCSDSVIRFKARKDGEKKLITRDCKWVARKSTNIRCALNGVSEICPATCRACSNRANTPLKMRFVNPYANGVTKITKTCDWVAANDTESRCAVAGINDACCKTCGKC